MMVLLSFLMLLGAVLGLIDLDTWLGCIAPLFLVTKMQNPGIIIGCTRCWSSFLRRASVL